MDNNDGMGKELRIPIIVAIVVILVMVTAVLPAINFGVNGGNNWNLTSALTYINDSGYVAWATGGLTPGGVPVAQVDGSLSTDAGLTYDFGTATLNATHYTGDGSSLTGLSTGGATSIGMNDDVAITYGTGGTSSILFETADANANELIIGLPDGGATDVPVLAVGDQSILNKDLTLFNGITVPTVAILDATETNYLRLDGTPMIYSNTSIPLKPSGDTDDYFTFATASNIPTIYGTGGYVRIGDAGTTGHSLASEDDLMVSGKLEVDGSAFFDVSTTFGAGFTSSGGNSSFSDTDYGVTFNDNVQLKFGSTAHYTLEVDNQDANAINMQIDYFAATNYVPVITFSVVSGNFGLFDGLTQPLFTTIEKGGQLHTATDGIANAGGATAILNHVGGFTNAVVGDIVRITAGTSCTVGWYWVTTKTSNDVVVLDRNYTSGDTTNVTFVTFHNFPMIGADGVCLKVFDGAPDDNSVEIDRDGWLALDAGTDANGRLYFRSNNAWHYVAATAGVTIPDFERVDPTGHKFEIGDTVKFVVDKVFSDGSVHALPYYDYDAGNYNPN